MPFYLYGTAQEMHIDHVLLRVPNAQLSAGEVIVELLEGDRSVFVAGLKCGLIAVADAIPEVLMQPLTADSLKSFFHPGAKLAVSIYHDRKISHSKGPGLCDQLGDPITRGIITLGLNIFTDAYMINVDAPTVMSQALNRSLTVPETTRSSQDHPLLRGYGKGGSRVQLSSPERAKTWRNMWNEALTSQSSITDSSTSSLGSTPVDRESYFALLIRGARRVTIFLGVLAGMVLMMFSLFKFFFIIPPSMNILNPCEPNIHIVFVEYYDICGDGRRDTRW
jgi:hypothetical protein